MPYFNNEKVDYSLTHPFFTLSNTHYILQAAYTQTHNSCTQSIILKKLCKDYPNFVRRLFKVHKLPFGQGSWKGIPAAVNQGQSRLRGAKEGTVKVLTLTAACEGSKGFQTG